MSNNAIPYAQTTLKYFTATDPVEVPTTIYDGRTATDLRWDVNGFELRTHPSAVTNWQDVAALQGIHMDEIETVAREVSGCDAVLFYPPVLRNPQAMAASEDFHPIEAAHSDYTEAYADMIRNSAHPYREVLRASQTRAGLSDAEIEQCQRVLTLQFWRNTGPVHPDYPLTFCDCRTVKREHMAPILVAEYGGLRTEFESLVLLAGEHTQGHRWFTFPNLTADEVVMFRAYDSALATAAKPFWTPHCAFADVTAGAHPPPRESVEMRAICLFL